MTAWDIEFEKFVKHMEELIAELNKLEVSGKSTQADIKLRNSLRAALEQYHNRDITLPENSIFECPDCGADLAVEGHTKECERYRNEARGWP